MMKGTINTFALGIVMFALLLIAQDGYSQSQRTLKAKAYANSSKDTAQVNDLGSMLRATLRYQSKDSANVIIIAETQPPGSATWTAAFSDTVTTTSNSGTVSEYTIRDMVTEKIPYVRDAVRFRVNHQSSGNGVTSGTYSLFLDFR